MSEQKGEGERTSANVMKSLEGITGINSTVLYVRHTDSRGNLICRMITLGLLWPVVG